MQLADWLKKQRMTGAELAQRLNVDDATINRLIPREGKKQVRKPSLSLAEKIFAATGGEVTPNDFMEREPPGSQEHRAVS